MTYNIETELRNYNSVDNAQNFYQIRKNWKDNSKVIKVYKWTDKKGWIRFSKKAFNPYEKYRKRGE